MRRLNFQGEIDQLGLIPIDFAEVETRLYQPYLIAHMRCQDGGL